MDTKKSTSPQKNKKALTNPSMCDNLSLKTLPLSFPEMDSGGNKNESIYNQRYSGHGRRFRHDSKPCPESPP